MKKGNALTNVADAFRGFLWRSGRDSNPRAAFDDNTISSRARYDLFDTTAYSLFAVNSKIYYTKFLALVNTYFPKSERIYEQDVPENTLPINFL